MHACMWRACACVCFWMCVCVWEREEERKRITSLGKLPSECGIECTLLMETEAFLSALPSSGIEGQIVSVVCKWARNNAGKVKKLVNQDYCVFTPTNKQKLPHWQSVQNWLCDFLPLFYPTNLTIISENRITLGPFITFTPFLSMHY